MADRWKQANAAIGAYLVLKVFGGYRSCLEPAAGWHQYAPAVATDSQAGYSFSISPGFDKAGELAPRLARDPARWNQNIRDMVASNAPFQLVTTMNEWGEGTSVESAQEWSSASGHGLYLDALHSDGQGPAPPPDTTPPAAPTGLSATAGDRTIALDWSDNSEADLAGYRVYRRNADGSWPASPLATPTASQWSDGGLTNGVTYTYRVTAGDAAGNQSPPSVVASATPVGAPATGDPVVAAAGDIACDPLSSSFNGGLGTSSSCRQKYTSDLLVGAELAAVLAAGGHRSTRTARSPSSSSRTTRPGGASRTITHPAVGNHEYQTPKRRRLLRLLQWGGRPDRPRGRPQQGLLQLRHRQLARVALNSNCSQVGGCGAGSPQETWLQAGPRRPPRELHARLLAPPALQLRRARATPRRCSRSGRRSTTPSADVVLTGHDHGYERFAPQTPAGARGPQPRHPRVRRRHGREEPLRLHDGPAQQPGSRVTDVWSAGARGSIMRTAFFHALLGCA